MFDNDGPWENDTIEGTDPFSEDPSEYEEVEEESDLCDCDPKHKESQTVQQSAGVNFGGFGGKVGDGTIVIVCTKCGGKFRGDEERASGGSGFDPVI
jgi:hypothetical protein